MMSILIFNIVLFLEPQHLILFFLKCFLANNTKWVVTEGRIRSGRKLVKGEEVGGGEVRLRHVVLREQALNLGIARIRIDKRRETIEQLVVWLTPSSPKNQHGYAVGKREKEREVLNLWYLV
jgi:hypothetical protein